MTDKVDLEQQLAEEAEKYSVSVPKLRAIYKRGVSECISMGYTEPPTFHGLARVQRFLFALDDHNSRFTKDADLLPKDYSLFPDEQAKGIETTGNWPMIYQLLNSNQLDIFPDETVLSTSYDIDVKVLTISGEDWSYVYDFNTGETTLNI